VLDDGTDDPLLGTLEAEPLYSLLDPLGYDEPDDGVDEALLGTDDSLPLGTLLLLGVADD